MLLMKALAWKEPCGELVASLKTGVVNNSTFMDGAYWAFDVCGCFLPVSTLCTVTSIESHGGS